MTLQEKKYKEIFTKVADDLGLPYNVVERTYNAFWVFVRTSLSELPLKDNLTEEDFKNLKTSINIPSLGKFNCTYDKYNSIKRRYEYLKQLQK